MALDLQPVIERLSESHRERGTEASVATMTIVVFFEDPELGELARERIRTLAGKHPSRVIVLDGSQSLQPYRVENFDWIELGVAGSDAQVLRSAVCTLRLPEAPVVLAWIAPGIDDDPRFSMLCENVQTVVYNSSLVDTGHTALCELVDYVEAHSDLPLADIAYLRLAPWQECVAIFFDGGAAGELAQLQQIEITCGSEPEAYYLLGWLASRLQWKPATPGAFLNSSGKRVAFEIRRDGPPRRILRVRLASAQSSFTAELDADEQTILLSAGGSSAHAPRYRRIDNVGIPALVERAILWGRNDRIFQEALAAAGDILATARTSP